MDQKNNCTTRFHHFTFLAAGILISLFFVKTGTAQAQGNKETGGSLLARKYKEGDKYRYKLTCESFQNGKWASTTISICELRVVSDSASIPYDEIRWLSVKTLSPADTTDETRIATSTKPYRISLDPKGTLNLPKLDQPAMTEPITDFNTFIVAISPKLGTTTLQKEGDSALKETPVIGNFANGKSIIKGEDCLKVSVKLTSLTEDTLALFTSFMPPSHSCLSYIITDMNTPVVENTPNNFQMVMPAKDKKFNLQYGKEFFIIRSNVRRADGKIISADMFNQLTLKLKINCDAEYQNCQAQFPFSMERKLTLELLDKSKL